MGRLNRLLALGMPSGDIGIEVCSNILEKKKAFAKIENNRPDLFRSGHLLCIFIFCFYFFPFSAFVPE
jgi:hypothetical protein